MTEIDDGSSRSAETATERYIAFGERGERQENLPITAESLYEDNHSPEAIQVIEEFNEARRGGNLTIVSRCSDARAKSIGRRSVSIGSIAAARTPSEKLLSDNGVARGIVLTHFDGDTIKPGQMPSGCGGLAAKGNEQAVEGTQIAPYVRDVIDHKDPFVQSLRTAERMAYINGKPVAALAIDHLSDTIYPIAFFQRKGKAMSKVSAINDFDIADYDPQTIYKDGMPTIDEDMLPGEFQELLAQNRDEQAEMLRRYPDLRQMQKVQRPRVVLFSTDIRSAKKFPRLARIPGSVFKVFTDRQRLGDEISVTPESMATSLSQLWYPLSHAVENHGNPEKPFSNTDRLIIETPSLSLSRELWSQAQQMEEVNEWLKIHGNRVILLQTNGGRVNDAAEIAR